MEKKAGIGKQLLLIAALGLITGTVVSKPKPKEKPVSMKIKTTQAAPSFAATDLNGQLIQLKDYRGKKVILTFYRNVGCPVCNFRFHELQADSAYFKAHNTVILAVYESTAANLKMYTEGEHFYATLIPNPTQDLYRLYDVEKSTGKLFKGMFKGAMKKMKPGKKMFKQKIKQDGSMSRIGADFVIDENGIVKEAYYGRHLGDHIPLHELKQLLQ